MKLRVTLVYSTERLDVAAERQPDRLILRAPMGMRDAELWAQARALLSADEGAALARTLDGRDWRRL